jgi:cytochrome c peroxidase
MSAAKVALGHQLFFDPRLSVDGSRSCYSCHQNENGNGGAEPTATGAANRRLTRHSPSIWNVAYMSRFYWDGRSGSLEAQAKGAWGGGNMGVGADNLDAKAAEIGAIQGYTNQFREIFGERGATAETVAEAIASYERTLVCDQTRYDRFIAGEEDTLNEAEQRGLELFNGKAGCATCHTPPFFSRTGIGLPSKFPASGTSRRVPHTSTMDRCRALNRRSVTWRGQAWRTGTLLRSSWTAGFQTMKWRHW